MCRLSLKVLTYLPRYPTDEHDNELDQVNGTGSVAPLGQAMFQDHSIFTLACHTSTYTCATRPWEVTHGEEKEVGRERERETDRVGHTWSA